MKTRWSDHDAGVAVDRYAEQGVSTDLALRTYSARLLGAEPTLVLHGGGNTSVKTSAPDLFGDNVDVLCVKGSGWDLATIEPAGHPAVRLAPLQALRRLESLSDEEMVNAQRTALMDAASPTPSVETLLHAFIAEKFIDHTHASAFLALADQPDAEKRLAEAFGDRVACVRYVMPGFQLAKLAAEAWKAGLDGLALVKHGLFTFGQTAQESYERMISLVTTAEQIVARNRRVHVSAALKAAPAAKVLPLLRGVLGPEPHWVLDRRTGPAAMQLVSDPQLASLAGRGVATPDHVIRTKRSPLVLASPTGDLPAWRDEASEKLSAFEAAYRAYFDRHARGVVMLDPKPRVIAIPGLGLIGAGRTAREAAIVADIAESWAATLCDAEAIGCFEPVGEADTFDMEYWSLEQAKLGGRKTKEFEGRIVVVTGAAGAIGRAVVRAFAALGAQTVGVDVRDGAEGELSLRCDVTRAAAVEQAFDSVCERFGGVDIVISNAGVAHAGRMREIPEDTLRSAFEINFFAHQNVARAAVARFQMQQLGGVLLFNVSKQAVNPGPDFGAYGASKAALLALLRQYAIEHGEDGVRVNGVNADRVRSGLLTPEMISRRAKARGVTENDYLAGNLLQAEVTAEDVADAFVCAARLRKTTGALIPVDGGNVPAMLR